MGVAMVAEKDTNIFKRILMSNFDEFVHLGS
jgi:hypothetical protein